MGDPGAMNLDQSWRSVLGDELDKDYMHGLQQFLIAEQDRGQGYLSAQRHSGFLRLTMTPVC